MRLDAGLLEVHGRWTRVPRSSGPPNVAACELLPRPDRCNPHDLHYRALAGEGTYELTSALAGPMRCWS